MLYRPLSLALVAAGVANAILIPPSMTAAELDLGDDMAMEMAASSLPRTVALECATCDVAVQKGPGYEWAERGGNSFMLDFEVGPRKDSLTIDGIQLYPPTFGYFTQPFRVSQVNPNGEDLSLRVTGYTFRYNAAETVSEAGIELIPMTFRITSIEGKPVDPPSLTINLLKDTNGRLMIASFQTSQTLASSSEEQGKACEEWPLLCKWRGIMVDRINGLKSSMDKPGCHKNKGNLMAEEAVEGKPPHSFRPGHPHHQISGENHHGHRHGHRHGHQFHMMFQRAFLTVVVPILIGVLAGTLTYVIGMALGCLVAVIVAKARGRSPYESLAQEDESIGDDIIIDEKEVYAQLPEYDAPPVYEDAAEKEVVAGTQ